MNMEKPTVSFGKFVRWEPTFDGKCIAVLRDVEDHPRLGDVPIVYTSAVQDTLYADAEATRPTRIETRNTIYVLRQESAE